MNHVFSEVPRIKCPRSLFQRNHNLKTTIGTDYLYPIYCDEALPADTFKFKQHLFGRLSTPLFPLMDNLYLDTFYFAVPLRLIWDDFQKFMGERPFGDSTTVYEVPQLVTPSGGVTVGSLSDYLGIPVGVGGIVISALWHRAYNLIYNTWFRDENLCPPVPVGNRTETSSSHTETYSDYTLLKRGKRHDYFTSCLPWPQKGQQAGVNLGTGSVPVWGDGYGLRFLYNQEQSMSGTSLNSGYIGFNGSGQNITSYNGNGIGFYSPKVRGTNADPVQVQGTSLYADYTYSNTLIGGGDTMTAGRFHSPLGVQNKNFAGLRSGVYADLDAATPIGINVLREAFALQSLLEIDARGGSRYIELLLAHFGVQSPDARMQRPEYLGGVSVPLNVTSVPQTSSTDATSPQGSLSAFVTVSSDAAWSKSFTEHCVILGLANVRADLSYQQGVPRMFLRKTRYDFYWPELANLGEQAVTLKELYATSNAITNSSVFGYQERWAEYRYHPNMITGLFRSTAANSLDAWHLAQKFESAPVLNQSFIEESVPISRVVAVPSEPPLILDGWFELQCARPMPLYSVPGLGRRL